MSGVILVSNLIPTPRADPGGEGEAPLEDQRPADLPYWLLNLKASLNIEFILLLRAD